MINDTLSFMKSATADQTRSYHYQGLHNGAFFRLMRRITSAVKNCFSPLARNLFPKGPEFVVYLVNTGDVPVERMQRYTTLFLNRVLKTRVQRRVEIISYNDFQNTEVEGKRFLTFTVPRVESTALVYTGTRIGHFLDRCLQEQEARGLVAYWTPHGDVLESEVRACDLQGNRYLDLGSFWTPAQDQRYNDKLDRNLNTWLSLKHGEE
ncbi:MAG: hypothetical protein ACK5MA_08635 [Parachlamydiaceae bacterium]